MANGDAVVLGDAGLAGEIHVEVEGAEAETTLPPQLGLALLLVAAVLVSWQVHETVGEASPRSIGPQLLSLAGVALLICSACSERLASYRNSVKVRLRGRGKKLWNRSVWIEVYGPKVVRPNEDARLEVYVLGLLGGEETVLNPGARDLLESLMSTGTLQYLCYRFQSDGVVKSESMAAVIPAENAIAAGSGTPRTLWFLTQSGAAGNYHVVFRFSGEFERLFEPGASREIVLPLRCRDYFGLPNWAVRLIVLVVGIIGFLATLTGILMYLDSLSKAT